MRDDWLECAVEEPALSGAKPVGEFTVVPDESGEKAAPLEDAGTPPAPIPPLAGMEPVVAEKWEPEGVWARNFGEERD